MKMFRVTAELDGKCRSAVVLAENEDEATCDPCFVTNTNNNSTPDKLPQYSATEITHASLHDLEAAHHCPRFVWRFNDSVSSNNEFREREYKRRYVTKPVSELRMPQIAGPADKSIRAR